MSQWINARLQLYDENDNLQFETDRIIEATGSSVWHEIGGEQSVTIPLDGPKGSVYYAYQTDRRVYLTVINALANTTHVICDFIIESVAVEERSLDSGEGSMQVLRISGRDRIKALAETPVKKRHISKYRMGAWPTSITETTLQMSPADTSAYPAPYFVGWTIELESGDWSTVVDHSAGGLLTIDPAWQTNVNDEDAPAPEPQRWVAYGAALTETTGNYTDLKLALRAESVPVKGSGAFTLNPQGYQSTATGSFLACNDFSVLKTLQNIAAQTGEYFVRTPGTRQIHWKRTVPPATHPQYGYTITLDVPTQSWPDSIFYAEIMPGQRLIRDSVERVTRVRPTGGGSGDEALTLRDMPDDYTPPPGYTIDGEYLISNAAEHDGLQVNKDLRFPAIAPASDAGGSRLLAGWALFVAAWLWLKQHDEERLILDCEVMTSIPIPAVTKVSVNLNSLQPTDGADYRDMYVLESKPLLKNDGSVTYQLKLSDKMAPILTDERLVAEAIRMTGGQVFTYNAPGRNSRKMDRMVTGKGGDGGGDDYLPLAGGTMTGNIAFSGAQTVDGVDISAHAANASAHHAPVSAGNSGIGVSGQAVSVALKTDSGLAVSSGLGLGTPTTLTAATTNGVSGSGHTHAVTTTANAKTTTNTILQGDSNGDLTVRNLTADKLISPRLESSSGNITINPTTGTLAVNANLSFDGARTINTGSGSLSLAPSSSLIAAPGNNVFQVNATTTLKTANAAVGAFPQTGWQINYDGTGYFTSLLADELRVAAFTADTFRVKLGGEYIPESMGELSRNMVIPAVNSTAYLYIWDAAGFPDAPLFADGDWVLLRVIDRSGGGLTVANGWGQVTAYADQPGGEQRWTFTTRAPTGVGAVGKIAYTGLVALDYGKTGSGWWYATSMDKGGPHAGVGMWYGANPTDSPQYLVRLGQLQGMSGRNEFGFQAGVSNSTYARFSQLGSEIHGARLSLYAGDNAQLRISAVQVLHWRTASLNTALKPNEDHTVNNVISTANNYWSTIDEGTASPDHNDHVANGGNSGGVLFVGLTNPTWNGTTYQVQIRITTVGNSFTNDTARLYGQIFQSDEVTPLTAESLLRTQTNNTTNTVTVTLPQLVATATQAQWNNARLRLRWEYDINANQEAIRLDPNVPSIAVGNPLPTGYMTGGVGFWTGRHDGAYSLRIGDPAASHMAFDGSTGRLSLRNGANDVIALNSDGSSYFERDMRLGANGGIWQGSSGTFASPKGGWKLWRDGSNKGRFTTYDGSGNVQVDVDSSGQLVTGGGIATLSRNGLEFRTSAAANAIKFISIYDQSVYSIITATTENDYNTMSLANLGKGGENSSFSSFSYNYTGRAIVYLTAGPVMLGLDTDSGAVFSGANLYVRKKGLAVGVSDTPALNRGVILADIGGEHNGPHIVLKDTGNIAHGMTDIASTDAYAIFRKNYNIASGLKISGFSKGGVGVNVAGYATTLVTDTNTSALGAVTVNGFKRSGAGAGMLADSENLFVVRNADSASRFIVKGGGNYHYYGIGAAYDAHDDVGLLRALSREMWEGTIDSVWDRFITTNRQNLIDAGIISDGGFINGAALNRLLTGAIWQLNERLAALEGRAS